MKNLIKKIVRFLLVVVVFAIATESYAQTFGVKAGFNLANQLWEDDDGTYSDDFDMLPGFHFGPTAEFGINENFSVETGLLLTTKGFKMTEEGDPALDEEYKLKLNLYYIDIPITAKAAFDAGGAKIYGTFGPYVGMGIYGVTKTEDTFKGVTETEEEDVEWGSGEDDHLKRLDFGLTAGVGVEIDAIQIGVSYGFGLANILPNTDDGAKVNNRVLGISIGYRFIGQ